MQIQPYLTFNGNCEEAMRFYIDTLGGEIEMMSRFKDGPPEMAGRKVPEELMEKVMHLTCKIDGNVIMASDSFDDVTIGQNITLSINLESRDRVDNIFNTLAQGGQPTLNPQETFWGSYFAMVTDQFGVQWMLSSGGGN